MKPKPKLKYGIGAARAALLTVGVLFGLLAARTATHAQPEPIRADTTARTAQLPPAYDGIDVEERLGASVPADLTFLNAAGETVRLGDYFDGRTPVVLNFVYHDCPMLCSIVLDGVTASLRELAWRPGREFEVLTVSFSPTETPELARAQKDKYLAQLDRPEAASGWHFLVGAEDQIAALADAVGFRYKWDPDLEQYAHPAVLVFLTGEGAVSRYFYGIQFPEFQMRAALMETADGKVGSMMEKLILSCYLYDPESQSYTADAMRVMRLAGGLFVLLLGGVLFVFWRREVRRSHGEGPGGMPGLSPAE